MRKKHTYQLQTAVAAARVEINSELPRFARAQGKPFKRYDFHVTSEHGLILDLAIWALAQEWSQDVLDEYFRRFYDPEKGEIDRTIEASGPHPVTAWARRVQIVPAAERARLESEYANASRTPTFVPKIDLIEVRILKALEGKCLGGFDLAQAAGFKYETPFKTTMSFLVRAGLADNDRKRGYSWGVLAEAAIERAIAEGVAPETSGRSENRLRV